MFVVAPIWFLADGAHAACEARIYRNAYPLVRPSIIGVSIPDLDFHIANVVVAVRVVVPDRVSRCLVNLVIRALAYNFIFSNIF